jgi:ribosomal protein S6
MRNYELAIVLSGKQTGAKREKVLDNIEKAIKSFGGKVNKGEEWEKQKEKVYYIYQVALPQDKVAELDKFLKTNQEVLRYLIIRG